MKKKRIILYTLSLNNNYGGILQNYALQKTLQSMDCSVVTNNSDFKQTPWWNTVICHDMRLNRILYRILQILGILLTDKSPVQQRLTARSIEKDEKVEDKTLEFFENLFLC